MTKSNMRKMKIEEMESNNVVMGVYYHASYLDEYFLGSEMISDPSWNERDMASDKHISAQAFSIKNGNVLVPIGESHGPYKQYERYNLNNNNQDITAVYKNVDWDKLNDNDIDYIYDLYCQYCLLEMGKIKEMENNNVVMGVYYYASDLDEYFLGSEMISDPTWNERDNNSIKQLGTEAFSINNGDNIIAIQDSFGPYKQYESYPISTNGENAKTIAVYKNIDWNKLNRNDLDYVYDLYCQYNKVKEQGGYQKVK